MNLSTDYTSYYSTYHCAGLKAAAQRLTDIAARDSADTRAYHACAYRRERCKTQRYTRHDIQRRRYNTRTLPLTPAADEYKAL
jgi:hypothetical protein